ncbi:hypothetical protein DIPPA_32236 [Diplonema papillatum]|nr:hypothetical protein DIPPA_32236 [Diplonema papillatum]
MLDASVCQRTIPRTFQQSRTLSHLQTPEEMPGRKMRLSKAARARLQEEKEIEADLAEQAQIRERVAAGNNHSNHLSFLMKAAGRMQDVAGVCAGENQVQHYGDSSCGACGQHWSTYCLCEGRPHSESLDPSNSSQELSPWRSTRSSAYPSPQLEPAKQPGKRASRRRSSSPRLLPVF